MIKCATVCYERSSLSWIAWRQGLRGVPRCFKNFSMCYLLAMCNNLLFVFVFAIFIRMSDEKWAFSQEGQLRPHVSHRKISTFSMKEIWNNITEILFFWRKGLSVFMLRVTLQACFRCPLERTTFKKGASLRTRGVKRDIEKTPKCTHLNCFKARWSTLGRAGRGDDDGDNLLQGLAG